MRKLLLTGMLTAAMAANAQIPKEDPAKYAEKITAAELKKQLTIIAGPEMEGRETATAGQRKAAAYIESEFKRIGLKPGNGDSYQMFYPLYQDELVDKKLSVNGKPFEFDKDYSLTLQTSVTNNWQFNSLVFAGYGTVDSVTNDYANLDVTGKVVLVLEGSANATLAPATPTRGGGFGAALTAKVTAARNKGAAGILIISKDFPKRAPTTLKGGLSLRKSSANGNFLVATVSAEAASSLLGRTFKMSFDDIKALKKGTYVSELKASIVKNTNELQSSNVVGVLPGTDKSDEYMFVTAHYDHEGIKNGLIYYGADDDGTGTTTVIEIAEAFAAAKKKGDGPRRNIVFMTVSGEEKGLLGSEYYGAHPIYPLAKTTADLNIDMIGRIDPTYKGADTTNYLYVIGDDKLSSDLKPITDEVNNKYIKMDLDRRFNDPKDPNRFYYRSDHYNFAKLGVPIIFYFSGTHRDYHKPTDTVDKINFDIMERRAKLIFHTAWGIVNKDNMMKRDIPLDMLGR